MARALLFPEIKISPESRIFYSDASYQGKLCLSLFSNSNNRLQRCSRNSVSKPISYRQFTQLTFTTNCWSKRGEKVHIQGLWSRMWLLSTFASCFKETRCCVHVCVAFKGCVKLLFIHANPHHWDATHIKSALTQETRHLSAKQSQSGNFLLGVWNLSCQSFQKALWEGNCVESGGGGISLSEKERANSLAPRFIQFHTQSTFFNKSMNSVSHSYKLSVMQNKQESTNIFK